MTAGEDSVFESRDQIREALLQTAVYCGAPAALESFRVAERVLAEMGVE
jgi:4-carboxymuconolactone decarboxylase